MKRTRMLMEALLLATLFSPVVAQNGNVTVVSDTSWIVFRPNPSPTPPSFLGLAQNVCLNATSPLMCSMGVTPAPTLYNWPSTGWAADLSSLPTGARWIWAPNITGASTPAASEFTFETDFYVCDPPVRGTISLAADNFAEVSINGMVLPNSTSASPDQLTTFTVPGTVLRGSSILLGARPNQIKVKARNVAGGCASDNYQCNPAGIVLGASFEFMGTGECNGYDGRPYKTLAAEKLGDCPAGQIGSVSRVCVCGLWSPSMTKCDVAPPQCAGNNGKLFNVNDVELQSCPTGQIASPSSHRCLGNGSWDMPLGVCTVPVTCNGATGPLPVGAVETLACPPGQVGSPTLSHQCMATGQWGPTTGICILPPGSLGALCGGINRTPPVFAMCPAGTTCGPRRGSTPRRPDWCAAYNVVRFFTFLLAPVPSACDPKPLSSTDWFCDPSVP